MKYTIEEMTKETGAEQAGSHFSILSIFNPIKNEEGKITVSGIATAISHGFQNLVYTLQKSKLAQKATLYTLAGALVFSAGCANQKDDTDKNDENSSTITTEVDEEEKSLIPETDLFNILVNKSKSEVQKKTLLSVGDFLARFNITFADELEDYIRVVDQETGEDRIIAVRPALSWDEVMAMTLVYNDFSKEELIQIINGSELDAYELSNAYKTATLQLMGAHVLETSENPVRIDKLLQSEEAIKFYEKYHTLFLKAKESTGNKRLYAVQSFYDELYKDFPITDEVRQEGIAHADPRASIEPYKFSIIPMLSAAEMMFQNLEIDFTLSQAAIDYLNDIGACNIADDILEKAELISLTTTANDEYADYAAVRDAAIAFLVDKDAYVVDDLHRELSYLPEFQAIINGYITDPYWYQTTTTHTETNYYTETDERRTGDRDEAVAAAGEDAVNEAEQEAQDELDRENEAAREEAEADADEKADEMQQEEDKKREDLEDQVGESDQDYQDNIDDANEDINNGEDVNEDDLGHGTDFDDEHSDSNGDLDDSVEDITTDGSGAVNPDEPLPDPNAEDSNSYSSEESYGAQVATESQQSTTESETSQEDIYEYEEPYIPTSEEDIDAYIESLAASQSIETGKVYTYTISC